LDELTQKVKGMYEKYPYPSGSPTIRIGNDARLLLSYVEQGPKENKPLNVLDAGCGRGMGIIGGATTQPDIFFTGADIYTVALDEIKSLCLTRGLKNVQVVQADLMTLENIPVPEGGFDVIISSGVLHHLSNPQLGLENLKKILAPHGVISIMVYASYGRQVLYRLINSLKIAAQGVDSLEKQIPLARLMAREINPMFGETIFKDTFDENDVELVDRCLNVNETSYSIDEMWQLLDNTGLKFIRWCEPQDWALSENIQDEKLIAELSHLSQKNRFKIIEQMVYRPSLAFIASHDSNEARKQVSRQELNNKKFIFNPEIEFSITKRNINQNQRIEKLHYKLRARDSVELTKGPLGSAIIMIQDQTDAFTGTAFFENIKDSSEASQDILMELLEREIIYCPHTFD